MAHVESFDGLSIFYNQAGRDGPPLLIVNGFGPPCEWMAEMYGRHFADRFSFAVSDLRGVGQSEAPADLGAIDLADFARDHLAVLDALGWETAHVYGGSMGASIAAQLALLAPERVRSLVLGSLDCGAPNIMSREYAHIVRTRIRYGKSILAQKTDPEGAADVILDTYYGDTAHGRDPKVRRFIVDMLTAHPMETDFPPLQFLKALPQDVDAVIDMLPDVAEPVSRRDKPRRDFVTGDLWEELENLRVPVLLLHGMDDQIIPYQSAVYAASKIPASELRLYKPMRHSISGAPQILRDIGDWMLRQAREA